MVMDNAKTPAAQGNSESIATHWADLFIKLFCAPAGIIFPFCLLPWPANLVVVLIIATLFEKGKFLSLFWYVSACLGALVLPLFACLDANYLHVAVLLCAVYACYAGWILAVSTKKRLARLWALPVMLGVFTLTLGVSLGIQRFQWIPYPGWCQRAIVKSYDYRVMEKFFGKALPGSFKITQVYFRPYFFPAPDGPAPVQYEAVIPAADYRLMVTGVPIERPKANDEDHYIRRTVDNEGIHSDLSAQYEKSIENQTTFSLLKVYVKKNAGWFCLDERTSPSLRLYISTYLPYRSER
jgi:hypothetical protein